MAFDDVRRCDEHPVADFSDEAELRRFVRASRWVSVDVGTRRLLRLNWVTTLLAVVVLWGFSVACLVAPERVNEEAGQWQSWVTQNFSWLYIGTQDVWAVFLLYIAFSKYGTLKLGRENERPEFDDLSWFAMLFSCGIGVGVYYFGVSEPMYYYRGGALWKIPMSNDDDRAQMAIFTTLFHWGLHGWCAYLIVAIALGIVCYRWNMPLTMRSAFYPVIGNLVYGPVGDFVDALSIACTTFGVCTSLGFGVNSINAGIHKLDDRFPVSVETQIAIVWVVTAVATSSVLLGLRRGIRTLALFTFAVGVFVILCALLLDNTWFLLNAFVQSIGHYCQWVVQVGFQTDAFQQLQLEFSKGANLLWGSSGEGRVGALYEAMRRARDVAHGADSAMLQQHDYDDVEGIYGSHNPAWIDWWTVFYWGWWISWAPFVGLFIARISRGRTIRQVIVGAFLAPTTFSFFWLVTFGSLGIKMQRVAELALGTTESVDWEAGTVDCASLGYNATTKAPESEAAAALAAEGYYALACRAHADRLFDVMQPYGETTRMLVLLCVVGVSLYFITSSDSGSYVDDILAANGMPNPPPLQKVFWAFTEGAVCTGLLKAGGDDALGALQAVSICAGLPYTFALCVLCTSIWRALKIDRGEPDICRGEQWSTGALDALDFFNPGPANEHSVPPYGALERVASLLRGAFAPFLGVGKAAHLAFGRANPFAANCHAVLNAAFFILWIGFLIASSRASEWAYVGWAWYLIMVAQMAYVRGATRRERRIYGSVVEDFAGCLTLYFAVASQLELQAVEHAREGGGNANAKRAEAYERKSPREQTTGRAEWRDATRGGGL